MNFIFEKNLNNLDEKFVKKHKGFCTTNFNYTKKNYLRPFGFDFLNNFKNLCTE